MNSPFSESAIQAKKKTATPSIFRSNAADTMWLTGSTRQSITQERASHTDC
jgi:hypothetical protein